MWGNVTVSTQIFQDYFWPQLTQIRWQISWELNMKTTEVFDKDGSGHDTTHDMLFEGNGTTQE